MREGKRTISFGYRGLAVGRIEVSAKTTTLQIRAPPGKKYETATRSLTVPILSFNDFTIFETCLFSARAFLHRLSNSGVSWIIDCAISSSRHRSSGRISLSAKNALVESSRSTFYNRDNASAGTLSLPGRYRMSRQNWISDNPPSHSLSLPWRHTHPC
jgi:hypothetical protein